MLKPQKQGFLLLLRESAAEQKRIQTLVITALLIAMNVSLAALHLELTPEIRVSFGFLTNAVAGMLFGPVVGFTAGAIGDVLSFFIRPSGPYFPGFSLTAALGGFIYGMFLYRRPITLPRAIAAKTCVSLFLNVILNTYWMVVMYGKSFTLLLPARLAKNLLLLPIEIALLFIVGKAVQKITQRMSVA